MKTLRDLAVLTVGSTTEVPTPPTATAPPDQPPREAATKVSGPAGATPSGTALQPNRGRQPLRDPVARLALAFVGADEGAEAYWYLAINDPNLPPNERQDLIEDLNEDGLSDPRHPTVDDLPLIVNRLLIIEEVGGAAMDKVNADAFQEAYKDFVNLANLALGGGEPVR